MERKCDAIDIGELAVFFREDSPCFYCKVADFQKKGGENIAESEEGSTFLIDKGGYYYPVARPIKETDMVFLAEKHDAPNINPGDEIVVIKYVFGQDDRIATMWTLEVLWRGALDRYERHLLRVHGLTPF